LLKYLHKRFKAPTFAPALQEYWQPSEVVNLVSRTSVLWNSEIQVVQGRDFG